MFTCLFILLRVTVLDLPNKISKNCDAAAALESFLSRNKCLFILCFRRLCNCYWLWSHHLQHGVGRRLRQGALMRGAVRRSPCILSIWVRTKMQIPPFVFSQGRRMRGHQIERAKFGAPAKPFEIQRRASLCQAVRWNPVAERHGWF